VHRSHRAAGTFQAGRDLQQTSWIGGDDDVGVRVEHVLHFPIPQRSGGVGFEQVVNAGRPAADVTLGDLAQLEIGDGPQYLARLATDTLGMLKVTGIVIGDAK
jgi:hypothetical protein